MITIKQLNRRIDSLKAEAHELSIARDILVSYMGDDEEKAFQSKTQAEAATEGVEMEPVKIVEVNQPVRVVDGDTRDIILSAFQCAKFDLEQAGEPRKQPNLNVGEIVKGCDSSVKPRVRSMVESLIGRGEILVVNENEKPFSKDRPRILKLNPSLMDESRNLFH